MRPDEAFGAPGSSPGRTTGDAGPRTTDTRSHRVGYSMAVPAATRDRAPGERPPSSSSPPSVAGATVVAAMSHDLLFMSGDLRATLEHHGRGVREEVESAPDDHVLQADQQEWAEALAERYSIVAPELRSDQAWMDEPRNVKVDVSWDHFRRAIIDPSEPVYVPGHQTVVHIPFTGDKTVFSLKPSSYTLNPPRADVGDGELRLLIEYPSDTPVDIKDETDTLVRQVNTWLQYARNDIEQCNSELEGQARTAIADRRQRIERHREHLRATGLPVGPPATRAKTYIAEALVRRPAPLLPSTPSAQPIRLEPVLADEVFEHILEVLRLQAVGIERSPKTYAGMGEEALRTVLLDALNTHYRGQGSAEAFNVGGKTDILVRHEGSNLFIAECKFWSGGKGFVATIDQLFGYSAWRDTKLAVIMFIRERDLTAIVEKAREALAEHERFVAWGEAPNETELRAVMSWPGDERRHAQLHVFMVSTPVS
jgi:hypothetical protein